MIETGIKTLKINAIKINKTLAEGNKSMKKLRAEEKRLFQVQQNKIKLKQREDLIEGKKKQRLGSGIAQRVTQPARSFIDKLKDFFVLLGAGILVNSLPAIIARIEKFLEDNKGIIDNIKFIVGEIGKLSMMFIELTQKLTPGKEKQIQDDLDELNKFLDGVNLNEIDDSFKDLEDIEKGLNIPPPAAPPGSLPVNPNPNPTPPAQRSPGPINYKTKKPVEVAEFNEAAKKVNNIINNANSPLNTKVFLPGVGYVYRAPGAMGSTSVRFEGPAGTPMSKDEFLRQSRYVEETIKGYSIGGTVKGTSYDTSNLTLDTKPVRTGSSIDSFSTFQKTTVAQANDLEEKTKSNNLLEDLVGNIRKLFGLQDKNEDDKPNRPYRPGSLPNLRDDSEAPIASNATGDKALIAAISALEGGNAQSRADVAQSIYNRAADPEKRYGSNIREVITADAQYQPAFIDPNASSGPGTKVDPIWKRVNDRDSAIDAMMSYYKKRKQSPSRESVGRLFDRTVAALGNRDMQVQAAEHVGGRTEFLGAGSYIDPRDRAELRSRGTRADNQFFTAYGTGGDTNESIKRGPAAVPKDLFPTVTAPPPVPGLQVNNPNIDRTNLLAMQSPDDVAGSTTIVFVNDHTIVTNNS